MAVIGSIRPPPFVLWTVLLTLAEDASANATANVTSNATTGIATDSASCQVGDNVTAIWEGDGKMYPAVIHSFGDDGTLTVDWADGDATFRTMEADKAQKKGFVCEPQIEKSERNMGMVALALCLLIVSIGTCSLCIWLADGRLKQNRGSKVTPADPASKLQCCDDEADAPDADVAKVPPANSVQSSTSQAHEGVADPPAPQATASPPMPASADSGSPDAVAAPPEDTSLNTEHIEEPPPAACQLPAEGTTEPLDEAVPPEASSVPAPASSSMQEARAADETASAPLAPPGNVESPPTVFATPPPITEADHKALSEWNDGVDEEPLSDSDNNSVAAKSEESV